MTYTHFSLKIECMDYINRLLTTQLIAALERGKSILLLGPRQTGKTTLIKQLSYDFYMNLAVPAQRLKYEKAPELFTGEIEALAENFSSRSPLVIIDEVQKVPLLMDAIQDLIDRKIAQFVLTGSSARKLRHAHQINLLPGRVVVLYLSPLSIDEMLTPFAVEDLLYYGSLPHIALEKNLDNKNIDLSSYVTTYLEEEVRAEAVVRNMGSFARFLELAASESGQLVNFSKLSQEIGVAHTTIAEYYQILEDCLIVERVEPLLKSNLRRRLTKTQKYLFFDLGVRRLCAHEGVSLPKEYLGRLFEQLIGLELIRCSRLFSPQIDILFWRDSQGPEVDWVIRKQNLYIPIEVKWSSHVTLSDAKYLQSFLSEYENTQNGYIICRVERKIKLADRIYAIPWQLTGKLCQD